MVDNGLGLVGSWLPSGASGRNPGVMMSDEGEGAGETDDRGGEGGDVKEKAER